ncbi:RING finger protein nhl-1 isoform X2 [Halyomorpha halys]|uniref:RING finger protein nhl-1 isoform X2 n=1 Tax=Halyomorpha halys TaxID=286706 RepID=UPI0006D4EF5F|nr:RING finger protein nhl-1 isoform X2 [Halyomorpha halys]
MEQFEQLLTCAICLDRYRNPKLLPCQHSFCMEPCMDGLVDYVRRQVKCPECRAEHRIPYQGVQGYPTNVTLQRFLELHIEITGEMPDPTSGQIMKRCAVCTEKSYCVHCSHCSKDVCPMCKAAHMDILRREISRINNQVRRALHRLEDMLSLVEKNMAALQHNCNSVTEEVDEIYRRLIKAAKDRTDFLKTEIDRYLGVEIKNLTTLKDNLQQEISNIQSNCDLADRHMGTEDVEWEDVELLDTKDIFLKTVDFIRNFEAEMGDYTRRVRFTMATDPNQLVLHVSTYGDLNIAMPHQLTGQQQLAPGPGLMRSKSDHRLAAQYRQPDERYGEDSGRVSPLAGRKFGQRYQRRDRDYDYEDEPRPQRSRTRSRFLHGGENTDSDNDTSGPRVRFGADQPKEQRPTALDTEALSKGPLSGISRLYDCPQVIARITEVKKPKPVEEPQPPVQQPKAQPKRTPSLAQRQVSEEDEITKIKRQMKNAPGERGTPDRPGQERVSALRREEVHSPPSSAPESPPPQSPTTQGGSSSESSDESSQQQSPAAGSRKTSVTRQPQQQLSRRSSTASDTPSTGGESARKMSTTGAAFTTEQLKQKFQNKMETPEVPAPKPFVSRFLRGGVGRPLTTTTTPAPVSATKEEEEEESSSSEETDSSEESSEEQVATTTGDKSDIGPLLARAAQARKSSRDETYSPTRSPTTRTPTSYQQDTSTTPAPWRTRTAVNNTSTEDEAPSSTRYGGTSSGFTSRFLNKSKSAAAVSPDEEDPGTTRRFGSSASSSSTTASQPAGSKSRYAALKDRKARLARSKSSHSLADDDDDDEPMTPSAYLASRYGPGTSLAKSRSSHAIKSRETSPEPSASSSSGLASSSSTAPGEKDGAALSSWARYLKNKYGSRNKDTMSSNSRRLSLGLPLRSDPEEETKNTQGSPTSPTQHPPFHQGFGVDTSTRSKYLNKRRQVFSLGSRGSETGCFTWPRGVATGPGDIIAVADSSNHRVQVFDSNGIFQKEFGGYGNGEGEFDCLAGVAVNRIGQFIIADRYNHRIQVMDPSGRFLRAFGSQGTADGKFNYPWGVTTDALGFIYVCDKENHRVQVFQSDGTFVGKFGSHGRGVGQLDHPHYIAVSNTNRVLVSDSNNHRVQVFDVNGRHISTIGSEGCEDGQFKFPRFQRSISLPAGDVASSSNLPLIPPTLERGSGSGRPGVYSGRGQREQPITDLQPRRSISEGVRLMGLRRGRVQGPRRSSSYLDQLYPRMRPREPPCSSVLRDAQTKLDKVTARKSAMEATIPLYRRQFSGPLFLPY